MLKDGMKLMPEWHVDRSWDILHKVPLHHYPSSNTNSLHTIQFLLFMISALALTLAKEVMGESPT